MIVWVLELGSDESRGVHGVYATPDLAIKAAALFGRPVGEWRLTKPNHHLPAYWRNNLDGNDAAEVWPYQLEGFGDPMAALDIASPPPQDTSAT